MTSCALKPMQKRQLSMMMIVMTMMKNIKQYCISGTRLAPLYALS